MTTYSDAEQRRLDQRGTGTNAGRQPAHNNPLTLRQTASEIARATGRPYRIALELLDEESLRELQRLLRDLHDDKDHAVRRARHMP